VRCWRHEQTRRHPFAPRSRGVRAVRTPITASALAVAGGHADPTRILKRAWPHDRQAEIILRASVAPTGLADFPVANITDAFRSLGPGSAAFQLLEAGLKVDLAGINSVRIPNVAAGRRSPGSSAGSPGVPASSLKVCRQYAAAFGRDRVPRGKDGSGPVGFTRLSRPAPQVLAGVRR
jgi:hypothetical protein